MLSWEIRSARIALPSSIWRMPSFASVANQSALHAGSCGSKIKDIFAKLAWTSRSEKKNAMRNKTQDLLWQCHIVIIMDGVWLTLINQDCHRRFKRLKSEVSVQSANKRPSLKSWLQTKTGRCATNATISSRWLRYCSQTKVRSCIKCQLDHKMKELGIVTFHPLPPQVITQLAIRDQCRHWTGVTVDQEQEANSRQDQTLHDVEAEPQGRRIKHRGVVD